MPKLKALRGAVGSYGRVAAGGIVEVDESAAEKLIRTGRFVRASAADIEAAQKAQKAALATAVPGAGKGFMPMPERTKQAEADLAARGQDLDKRAEELKQRDQELDQREQGLAAREEAIAAAEAKAASETKAKTEKAAK